MLQLIKNISVIIILSLNIMEVGVKENMVNIKIQVVEK